jgi:2-keto-4-pentenoate hydratase/2-oxohepta-3-ene-1,7-dioic acid hydratase in catechol pathway
MFALTPVPDRATIRNREAQQRQFQSSNTSDLIFNTRKMISHISQYFTLKPGDRLACSLEKLGQLMFDLV